ncbi:hypothetical protein CspHIS471_0109480 [Cutaneotrichosporon sp. HIS471]|nr:hypothetical protein CspHIS471_0109480 [Cutaneotrichosporon sp. HIS471]
MKASTIFTVVAALGVPVTAAPLKRDADQVDWRNGDNPFGKWNEDGSFEFTMNWNDAINLWRTGSPRPTSNDPAPNAASPQPTSPPHPEQPSPQPSPQPEPNPQPSPQPEPNQQPEQSSSPPPAVDSSSAQQRPADASTSAPASPSTTDVANKVAGEPNLPFSTDQTLVTQDPSAADIAGTSAQAKVALDYHNQWRAQFGTPALSWDSALAQKATSAMGTCKWEHSGADNLSTRWGTGDYANHFVHGLIDGWAKEWRLYDWNNPGFSLETGHFTAMTWKAVTKVGCGWKLGCKDASPGGGQENKIYFSCVYDPVPNMSGADDATTRKNYEDNVPRYIGN